MESYTERLKIQIRHILPMFICTLLTILLWSVLIIQKGSADLFLELNKFGTPELDQFFPIYTNVGDGYTFAIVAVSVLLIFRKRVYFFTGLVVTIGSSLLTQIPKRLIFPDEPRPLAYFNKLGIKLRLVEGVEVHEAHSFPSGHTITGFAMFTYLAIVTKDKRWQIPYFFAGFLVGYSRIYLSQHFPADVLAGTIIGTFLALLGGSIWLPISREGLK